MVVCCRIGIPLCFSKTWQRKLFRQSGRVETPPPQVKSCTKSAATSAASGWWKMLLTTAPISQKTTWDHLRCPAPVSSLPFHLNHFWSTVPLLLEIPRDPFQNSSSSSKLHRAYLSLLRLLKFPSPVDSKAASPVLGLRDHIYPALVCNSLRTQLSAWYKKGMHRRIAHDDVASEEWPQTGCLFFLWQPFYTSSFSLKHLWGCRLSFQMSRLCLCSCSWLIIDILWLQFPLVQSPQFLTHFGTCHVPHLQPIQVQGHLHSKQLWGLLPPEGLRVFSPLSSITVPGSAHIVSFSVDRCIKLTYQFQMTLSS